MPRVAVVIPTHNRAHLLGRAIESVLQQSFDDFQLVIVDDGSIDDTSRVVESFEDARIRYLRYEVNRGVSAARNTGIETSAGEFVAFLDSDDAWLNTKLERQVAAFDNGSETLGVVYSRFRKIGWRYEPEVKRWNGDIRVPILVNNCVGTASTPMIRRHCIDSVGGFDESLRSSEDWDLWIRLADEWEFECINEELVHYYPQRVSLTEDRTGALRAYEALFRKHADRIASLDDAACAEHYFYRGRIYLAHRQFKAGSGFIARALRIDPSNFRAIAHYLVIESARKLLHRVQPSAEPGCDL